MNQEALLQSIKLEECGDHIDSHETGWLLVLPYQTLGVVLLIAGAFFVRSAESMD